jgi:hypothetical protein
MTWDKGKARTGIIRFRRQVLGDSTDIVQQRLGISENVPVYALQDKAHIAVVFFNANDERIVDMTAPVPICRNKSPAQLKLRGDSLQISNQIFPHATAVSGRFRRRAFQ